MTSRPGGSPAPIGARLGPDATSPGTSQRRRWALVAAAVVLVGAIASAVAGMAVAQDDGEHSRQTFETRSMAIASTLQMALQHEDDLVVNASAFFTEHPDASTADLGRWAAAARVLPRYPELRGLGFAVLVTASELDAYAAEVTADPGTALDPGTAFEVLPPGERPFYCFGRLGLSRDGTGSTPPGFDFCAGVNPGVLDARDSGVGTYQPLDMGDGAGLALSVQTPIYRSEAELGTVAARRAAFVGWAGVVLDPTVVVDRALVDHPDMAAAFRYGDTTFRSSDSPAVGSATHSVDLENGWTLETFGQVTETGVFRNWSAFGLMAVGIAMSLLLGLLVWLLATGRARALGMVAERTDELRHQALHDALTGLPNRALIMDRIERLQARDRRNGTSAATLFLDLDGFKSVNDTLGHDAGDRLLRAVAERLSTALRDVDTIGRMGGDEFVILVDGGAGEDGPALVAERVLDVIRQPVVLADAATPVVVTASIGIAMNRGSSPVDALRDADMALYEAKDGGKNRYEIFRPEMETTIRHRYELELDLRTASNDQFHLVYQPIYNLDDLSVVGVEALIRWQHPTVGVIQPDDFVPLLETSGLIVEVGRWVLLEACTQMAAWRARGSDLGVSVNVSGRQLDHDVIVDDVRNALAVSGLDPAALTIEITETAVMRDIDKAAGRLRELKDIGVQIAIDDFGTGYSSLAYLRRLRVDCLKIDRSFTDSLTRSADSDAVVHTLVQLGRDLGLRVLAEGVETTDQIDHMRGEHVDEAQGFLLARPLSAARIEALLLEPSRPVDATS